MSLFRTSREFPSPPDAVFAAIQDPVRLARWWGPDRFTNSFQTFDFQPGGRWVFTMHGPDGTDYPNESEFLEVIPNALVRLRHTCEPHFELSIALEAIAGGTLLTWTADFENHAFAEARREFLEAANEQNLDRLAHEIGRGA